MSAFRHRFLPFGEVRPGIVIQTTNTYVCRVRYVSPIYSGFCRASCHFWQLSGHSPQDGQKDIKLVSHLEWCLVTCLDRRRSHAFTQKSGGPEVNSDARLAARASCESRFVQSRSNLAVRVLQLLSLVVREIVIIGNAVFA